jgi:hypothetical protein
VAAPAVDAGHELLASEAALGEADGGVEDVLPHLGGDGGVGQLGPHGRDAAANAQRLVGVEGGHGNPDGRLDVGPDQVEALDARPLGGHAEIRGGGAAGGGLGAGAAQGDDPPVDGVDVGLGPEQEPSQAGDERLAVPAVDVEDDLVVGRPDEARPRVDLARWLQHERPPHLAGGEVGDVVAELALQVRDGIGAGHAHDVTLDGHGVERCAQVGNHAPSLALRGAIAPRTSCTPGRRSGRISPCLLPCCSPIRPSPT